MALKEGKKQTKNKQTDNLNRTVKVLNLLIYRAPPTVYFHRIVHSFKKGRFLIKTISFNFNVNNFITILKPKTGVVTA